MIASMDKAVLDHLNTIDRFLKLRECTDKSLVDWFSPLIPSINSGGAVSYLLNQPDTRFRASPLASTITWLDNANLLPNSVIELMQGKLLFLRDNNEPNDQRPGQTNKHAGDEEGWSLGEGVSIWSTSLAIRALIDNNKIGLQRTEDYKSSVLWLAKQKKVGEDGWGYQNSPNCQQNIIMTSLAVRSIALALKCKDSFGFSNEETSDLEDTLISGFRYIKESMQIEKTEAYWCFNNEKNCAATTWALLALKELNDLSLKDEIGDFYSKVIKDGQRSLINSVPKSISRWGDECIVMEAGAKYGSMKNYYSFSPTLIMDFFDLGISPFNIRIVNQIRWLINNQKEWKITKYDTQSICSFTYAMIIATIVRWVALVGTENSKRLIFAKNNRINYISEHLLGVSWLNDSPIQIFDKNCVLICILFLILVITLILIGPWFTGMIKQVIIKYLKKNEENINTIVINLISNTIYGVVVLIIGTTLRFIIRKVSRRV